MAIVLILFILAMWCLVDGFLTGQAAKTVFQQTVASACYDRFAIFLSAGFICLAINNKGKKQEEIIELDEKNLIYKKGE